MSTELEATAETTITVRFSKDRAEKTERSLGRVLEGIEHMDHVFRAQVVNAGAVDDLLALRTVLQKAMGKW
jgi:hypothetical protein